MYMTLERILALYRKEKIEQSSFILVMRYRNG